MVSRLVFRSFMLAAVALAMSACGSIQTRSKDEARVKAIKNVAVVAFQVEEPAAGGIGLVNGSLAGTSGGSMIAKQSKHVDQMYVSFNDALSKNVGWSVLPIQLMKSNKGYKQAFHATMDGFQNKMPPGQGINRFLVSDIMDTDSPRILDVQGRDLLIDQLAVDAIVVARVTTYLNGFSVMGIGSKKPQASVSFSVYRKGDEKPTWFEGGIKGDEQPSIAKTRFFSEDLLAEKSLASAETAFARINQAQQ